jgi:hypothetical protein
MSDFTKLSMNSMPFHICNFQLLTKCGGQGFFWSGNNNSPTECKVLEVLYSDKRLKIYATVPEINFRKIKYNMVTTWNMFFSLIIVTLSEKHVYWLVTSSSKKVYKTFKSSFSSYDMCSGFKTGCTISLYLSPKDFAIKIKCYNLKCQEVKIQNKIFF